MQQVVAADRWRFGSGQGVADSFVLKLGYSGYSIYTLLMWPGMVKRVAGNKCHHCGYTYTTRHSTGGGGGYGENITSQILRFLRIDEIINSISQQFG